MESLSPYLIATPYYDPPACARLTPLHAMPHKTLNWLVSAANTVTAEGEEYYEEIKVEEVVKTKKPARKKRLAQRTTLASNAKNSRIKSLDENNMEEQELREASANFKDRRLELDYSQVDVAKSIAGVLSSDISQTTISRYETFTLSTRNMRKIKPMLDAWLEKAIEAVNGGITPAEFLTQSKAVGAANASLIDNAASDDHINCGNSDEYFHFAAKPTEPHPYIGRRRRSRTMLTPEQRTILQDYFALDRTPCDSTMRKLSDDTELDINVIKTWFANSRQAARKKGQVASPTTSTTSNSDSTNFDCNQTDECADVINLWADLVSSN